MSKGGVPDGEERAAGLGSGWPRRASGDCHLLLSLNSFRGSGVLNLEQQKDPSLMPTLASLAPGAPLAPG